MNIEKLAKSMGVDQDKARSHLFSVIDQIIEEGPSDSALENASGLKSPLVSVDGYRKWMDEVLWGMYEET